MFDFKILFAIIFIIISDENVNQVFFAYMYASRTYFYIRPCSHEPGTALCLGASNCRGTKIVSAP